MTMIQSVNAGSGLFLTALDRISARMQRAQMEIGTGRRINVASDDPGAIAALTEAQTGLKMIQQTSQNLGRVKTEVDTAEGVLQSAVQIMERVETLGAQGITGTQTADSRSAIASELGSLLEQLGQLSCTSVEGRFIFSGDQDQTAPYTIDLTQANPVGTYQGSSVTRRIQHPNGCVFAVSRDAQQIFDSATASENVFHAVSDLRTAMLNNDEAALSDAYARVQTATTYLNGQLAFYGAVQNKVSSAIDYASKNTIQLQTEISGMQDADVTAAIVDFQQAQTQQQAAFLARAQMPNRTLFDYLA